MHVRVTVRVLQITNNVYYQKVGGTKHRASPPLQKVGGTCPPVHPRNHAHVYYHGCTVVVQSTDCDKMLVPMDSR